MPLDSIRNYIENERPGQVTHLPARGTTYTIPRSVPESSDSLEVKGLVGPLWRRKWTIAGIAVLGLLIGLGVSFLIAPTYRAHASLQIEGMNNDQYTRELNPISSLPNSTPENYLQNEVKLLQSETLASRVAQQLGAPLEEHPNQLRQLISPLIKTPEEPAEDVRLKNVQKALSVRTSLQSQVLDLYYDAPSPDVAARGANLAASELVDLNREARYQSAQDTTAWLNKQAADLKATLESSNRQLEDFARTAGLVFAGKQGTLAEDRMRQIQDSLARAEADRAARQARYEAALANPNAPMSDVAALGPMRVYQENLQKLREELAQLKTLYTPNNYRVERVQAQITETENAIDKERQEIVGRLRTEYLASNGLERRLAQDEEQQLKTVEEQMEKERRYDAKKSEIDATQRLYESVLEKVKEAGAVSALRTTNVRVLDTARVPFIPYRPNWLLNMALGFGIGALGGVGLVLMSEGTKADKVSQPGESTVLLDVPELGVIPAAQDVWRLEGTGPRLFRSGKTVGELGLVTRERDSSMMAESFRAALTSILFSGATRGAGRGEHRGGRILVFTSVDVMEGKTTVFTNLGIAAAEARQRVLLVDADVRRPRLHQILDVPNSRGLTDLLRDHNTPAISPEGQNLVEPTSIPNLWALTSGLTDSESHKLLYSGDLSKALQRFRDQFDLILIDTAPVMMFADARVAGSASDGVVMVVRANSRSRAEVRDACLKFAQDQTPVLGTILNQWRMDSNQTRVYGRYHNHYQHTA